MTSDAATVTVSTSESGSHEVFNEGILVIFGMLMIFMLFEAYKHKNNLKFGHEASLVCVIGILISALFAQKGGKEFNEIMEFNGDLFFYFVLPPIVFASGFNMYRKKFFANIRNITLFGVLGTFITFAVFSGLTYLVLQYVTFTQTQIDPKTGESITTTVSLTTMEILLMCSLLCSSDVIAAVSLLNPKKQPKLFSLVFGEGIVNDAVAIILFNTVNDFAKNAADKEFNAAAVGFIALDFLALGIISLLIGLVFGLIQSYLMKKARSFTRDPVAECAIIFAFAYISYVTAELLHQSGIITLLTCGVTMAHYGWYNLSPQGQTSSAIVFQFLGFLAEGFVFSYLGLTFFSYRSMPFSVGFVSVMFFIVLAGRAASTLGLISLLKLCGYEKNNPARLNYRELVFIWIAGVIRGAIAFGLVLRIDKSFAGRELITTTCLSLVLLTTIIFGSTVGLLGSCLFPETNEAAAANSEVEGDLINVDELDDGDQVSDSSDSSHRSGIYHPNRAPLASSVADSQSMVNNQQDGSYVRANSNGDGFRVNSEEIQPKRKRKTGCIDYLSRFDEFCMKPIFIRKYTAENERIADEFVETYMETGEKIEHDFAKQNGGKLRTQNTHVNSGRHYRQD